MERQLPLLDLERPEWRLDERTREVGRQGLAAAREALRRGSERAAPPGGPRPHGGRRAA